MSVWHWQRSAIALIIISIEMKPGVVPEAHAYIETAAVPLPIAEAYVVQQQPLLTLAAAPQTPDLYEPFGQPQPQPA